MNLMQEATPETLHYWRVSLGCTVGAFKYRRLIESLKEGAVRSTMSRYVGWNEASRRIRDEVTEGDM
jgi:hypothetical protein